MRKPFQTGIDPCLYRRKYDAAQTRATLCNEVDLEQLREELVLTEMMQPSHVSLWLPPAATKRQHDCLAQHSSYEMSFEIHQEGNS